MRPGIDIFCSCIRRAPLDRRIKLGLAELCYHMLRNRVFDYTFECEHLGIRWSAAGFPDLLTRHMMFEGLYQEDVLECIRHFAKKGDIVFDIGGHHGLMAMVASRAVGNTGRVVTFEPNPMARRVLEQNLLLNGVSNVDIESSGVSDTEGSANFYIQEGGRVSWNSSFVEDFVGAKNKATRIVARTTTIDRYARRSNLRPSLMKIDTESAEMQILLGAKETVEKHRPVLLVEMNPKSARRANTTIEQIVRFLREHRYEMRVLRRLKRGRYSYAEWEEFAEEHHCRGRLANVACVPNGR